ncbi:MAG: hypothetical protein MR815_00020, partial [Oscillospiraceae bacterium]|nr:hypothetical protein [Oscillospiraceae bacterium]
MLAFLIALTTEEEIGTRSGHAGPSFSARPEKEAKGAVFARHFGSGKMKPRTNPFGEPSQTRRFTSSQTHGKVRFYPTGKNPLTSHAVSKALCCLGLPSA